MEPLTLRPIGHMESDFSEKFGIPRQSGLVEDLRARVVLEIGRASCRERV